MITHGIFANSVHTATPADLPRLRELFERANDAPYDLVAVAGEKCFEEGLAGPPTVTVHGDFLGAAVTCGKYLRILAVDRAQRNRGIGTALLREAWARGARIVGAEAGNYFTPGVFEASQAFFAKRGRQTASTQNLECGSRAAAPARSVAAAGGQTARVLDFIEREFGPIWRFEVARGTNLFYAEVDGQIAGFAAHDANNRGLGFFGPTGVARQFRGRGLGRDLLLAALADMQRQGYERVIIPWTDALDFYAKSCGAAVAHRFATFLIDSAP